VLHRGEVLARREVTDEDGVVHHYREALSGEMMDGGPVMLSWSDVADAGASAVDGYNVVIHEFAHKIDMRDGEADGCPPLPPGFLGSSSAHRLARSGCRACRPNTDRFSRSRHRLLSDSLDLVGDALDGRRTARNHQASSFAVAVEAYFVNPAATRPTSRPGCTALLDSFFRPRKASVLEGRRARRSASRRP
jgi:Mlc titration factor MtfA (ptsG expression regulator)